MKGLKFALPLLVALSVALGPAFLPGSRQEALAAQAKPKPSVRPATAGKPKPAKTAKRKPPKPAKRNSVKAAKHKLAKPAKPRKPAKHVKKSAKRGKKTASGKAGGAFLLCRHDGSVRVHAQGRTYLVNNNNFMGLAECLSGSAHAPAFRVARSRATSTGPDSDAFPDIYTGCSWGRCSPDAKLPARVSDLGDPVTTWDTTENAGGLWAATYDVWFDQRPIRTGQANAEMPR